MHACSSTCNMPTCCICCSLMTLSGRPDRVRLLSAANCAAFNQAVCGGGLVFCIWPLKMLIHPNRIVDVGEMGTVTQSLARCAGHRVMSSRCLPQVMSPTMLARSPQRREGPPSIGSQMSLSASTWECHPQRRSLSLLTTPKM